MSEQRPERPDRQDRHDRHDRQDQPDRPEGGPRPERPAPGWAARPGHPAAEEPGAEEPGVEEPGAARQETGGAADAPRVPTAQDLTAPDGTAQRRAPQGPTAKDRSAREQDDAYDPFEAKVARGLARVTGAALAPYQTAVIRIGFSLTWLLFLLRELPHAEELWGPDGPWSWELGKRLVASNHAFTVLLWSDSGAWFVFVYAVAMLSSVALLLGWRTRTASVIFMIGVLSLENRSVFVGDGGDNVLHLMSLYMIPLRCGQVWSLDARRLRRQRVRDEATGTRTDATGALLWCLLGACLLGATAAGGPSTGWALVLWGLWLVQALWWIAGRRAPEGEARRVLDAVANVAHNGTLLVVAVQVCFIYATAGWYKIQGSRWEDGTALYYPMHLDYFAPWPALSTLLAASGLITMVITYGTVIVQVAFPFTLFNRRVKNVLLAAMIMEHLGIAVLLGLPFFSLAMITADAVFLPTAALVWTGDRVARLCARPARRGGREPAPGVPDGGDVRGTGGTAAPPPPRPRAGDGSTVR